MSGKTFEASDPLRFRNILLLPVYHGTMEFAVAAREELLAFRPDAIAVELPPSLEEHVRQAALRLPFLSVVITTESDGSQVYFPVEPQDAIIEAIRFGQERDLPVHFIDAEIEAYPQHREPLPDAVAVSVVGLRELARAYRSATKDRLQPRPDGPDALRERTMAANLSALSQGGTRNVAAVFGLAHYCGILRYLAEPDPPPLSRKPKRSTYLANLHRDSSREILSDTPFVAMAYETTRGSQLPAVVTARKGHGKVLAFGAAHEPPHGEPGESVKASPAHAPQGLDGLAPIEEAGICDKPPQGRADPRQKSYTLERRQLQLELIRQAAARHEERNGEKISAGRINDLLKFGRNWALLEGGLMPDFYQLCIAARSMGDDDFAYEVWELGSDYPWQDSSESLPTIRVTAQDLMRGIRKIRFRRKIKSWRRRLVPIRKRRQERFPGEWKKEWRGIGICSYSPEDIVIEGFGDYLRKKAIRMLAEEQSRVEPFTTSILDGIDMRETIRNWHKKKIYVRENRHISGKAGSIVIIFDPDEPPKAPGNQGVEEKFPYRMTWHGEHTQESDLACYATEPGGDLVGPGVSKCLYGGLMMTYPPRRVFDIWRDPFFGWIESKPDRLLAAAIDYCLEKYIVYVSAKPPRSWLKSLAERMGKKVVYVPLGQLSPVTLKKIRVFHILDGYHVRQFAKEYIL